MFAEKSVNSEDLDVEELLTEAQDFFFEGNYAKTIEKCNDLVLLKPTEVDGYALWYLSLFKLERYPEAFVVSKRWGGFCGPSSKQLKYLLESAYLSDDKAGVKDATEQIIRFRGRNSPSLLLQVTSACLSADIGEFGTSDRSLNACEGLEIEVDDEYMVEIMSVWAELCLPDLEKRERARKTLEERANARGIDPIESEDSTLRGYFEVLLARALLALFYMSKKDFPLAHELLFPTSIAHSHTPPHITLSSLDDDPNISGARLLFLNSQGDTDQEKQKKLTEKALKEGANILVRKRVREIAVLGDIVQ
eukprot:TRINITY_DN17378_c0_g1_i1.p1 TRINITY_DN17378_c0_g1~~TRINITY_DN17378_c0_g1_i1.p1  ORF type:complete len:307 (-),score=65.18 TRINITY_DN17378_c0_g1_i1:82-1002(-)